MRGDGTHLSKAERLSSSDRISTLPWSIIETILCLVPIKDAARTSILSRKWRYKWVKIPKLVFSEMDMFDESTDIKDDSKKRPFKSYYATKQGKVLSAIHQVLLNHDVPILEFSLAIEAAKTYYEIDAIIKYLSKKSKTLNKFHLYLDCRSTRYKLNSSFFSLQHLTDLYLQQCDLRHYKPTSNGFGSLTSLFLNNVETTIEVVIDLVSKSPLLKSFSLVISEDFVTAFDHDSVYKLFGYLPKIEHLYFCFRGWHFTTTELFKYKEFQSKLVHLKYAHLVDECFIGKHGLPFAVILIRSSPNLEKLKLQQSFLNLVDQKSEVDSVDLEEYTRDIWLEHLKELEIEVVNLQVPEMDFFVKLVMSKSPMLKKVRIRIPREVDKHEALQKLAVVTRFRPASWMVQIVVVRGQVTCAKEGLFHREVDKDEELQQMLAVVSRSPCASQMVEIVVEHVSEYYR